jgi:hypothetical protein
MGGWVMSLVALTASDMTVGLVFGCVELQVHGG